MLEYIVTFLMKPITGVLIGMWGVWLGLIQYYLGNPNGIPIMLVGIACLVLASIFLLNEIKTSLQPLDNKHKDEVHKVNTNTYITK